MKTRNRYRVKVNNKILESNNLEEIMLFIGREKYRCKDAEAFLGDMSYFSQANDCVSFIRE